MSFITTYKILIKRNDIKNIVEKCTSVNVEKVFLGIGVKQGEVFIVESVFECSNISVNQHVRFTIDPICIYNVYVNARSKGMDIVTLIHSHPATPIPSNLDLKGMSMWPIPWIIISIPSGEYRAWIIEENKPVEVVIEEIH